MLSGVGPADDLRAAGVEVTHDLPGVGRNLMDHPEGLVLWEAAEPIPDVGASDWDAIISLRLDPSAPAPDILCHIPLMTLADNSERLGFVTPEHSFSLTPNVAKPRSRGRVWIDSPDPAAQPLIDYGYFTDPEGHDERTLLAGMRDGAQGGGHRADVAVDHPRGVSRPGGAVGRGSLGARPSRAPHRVPRVGHLPDRRGRAIRPRSSTRSCGCAASAGCGWPTLRCSP